MLVQCCGVMNNLQRQEEPFPNRAPWKNIQKITKSQSLDLDIISDENNDQVESERVEKLANYASVAAEMSKCLISTQEFVVRKLMEHKESVKEEENTTTVTTAKQHPLTEIAERVKSDFVLASVHLQEAAAELGACSGQFVRAKVLENRSQGTKSQCIELEALALVLCEAITNTSQLGPVLVKVFERAWRPQLRKFSWHCVVGQKISGSVPVSTEVYMRIEIGNLHVQLVLLGVAGALKSTGDDCRTTTITLAEYLQEAISHCTDSRDMVADIRLAAETTFAGEWACFTGRELTTYASSRGVETTSAMTVSGNVVLFRLHSGVKAICSARRASTFAVCDPVDKRKWMLRANSTVRVKAITNT